MSDTHMENCQLAGAAGKLQARLASPELIGSTAAVLCHPHPQYGGNMDDHVLGAVERGLLDNAIRCLRFNFRGVGRSESHFDQGVGEVEDVLTALDYVTNLSGIESVYLAGYSFGAIMAQRAAQAVSSNPKIAGLILVAPPLQMSPDVDLSDQSGLVMLGQRDEIVDAGTTREAFLQGGQFQIEMLREADHFFVGSHHHITELVRNFTRETLTTEL